MQDRKKKGTCIFGKRTCKAFAALMFALIIAENTAVFAETDPTYKYTAETENADAFVVKIKTSLNVRAGAGTNYSKIKNPITDKNVSLSGGDLVAVMSEIDVVNKDESKTLWYEIRWIEDDIEFHGYINAQYTEKTGDPAIPLPTPTPVATNTPTPTPTPTPEIVKEKAPTKTPTPTPPAPVIGDGMSKSSSWMGIVIIIAILLACVIGYGLFILKKKKTMYSAERDTIKGLRNVAPENYSNGQQRERVRTVKEEDYVDEAENNAIYEANRQATMAQALKEKELIKKELDGLEEKDTVIHKYFGEGIVIDNSDVNNVEIKFGNEIRYINKESAAAKHLMRKL